MLEIVAELSHLARRAPEISQRSGVSVRVSIANLETLHANATRRALRLGEASAAPRISDLGAIIPSTTGKVELETLGDESPEERVIDRLLARAIALVFNRHAVGADLDGLVEAFESGAVIETGENVPSREYVRWTREIPGLGDAVARLGVGESPPAIASAVELLLEGLHLHRRLNKERAAGAGGGRYRA
jgi:magnesium chelatase subunit I